MAALVVVMGVPTAVGVLAGQWVAVDSPFWGAMATLAGIVVGLGLSKALVFRALETALMTCSENV